MSHHENTGRTLLLNNMSEQRSSRTPFETMNDDEVLAQIAKMNIILLGIPGAGKTTLSEELVKRHADVDYISLGDISRNLARGSPEQQYLEQLFQSEAPTGDPEFFLQLTEDRVDAAKQRTESCRLLSFTWTRATCVSC